MFHRLHVSRSVEGGRQPRATTTGQREASWRRERLAVESAYQRWTRSEGRQRKLAYAGYLAALEREEEAARVYARETERVTL
jgi:hypothetical protein